MATIKKIEKTETSWKVEYESGARRTYQKGKIPKTVTDWMEKQEERQEEKREEKREDEKLNVIKIWMGGGEEALKEKLEKMELEGLQKTIRRNHLDRVRKTARWKSKEKLMEYILAKTKAFCTQGDVFRHYKW